VPQQHRPAHRIEFDVAVVVKIDGHGREVLKDLRQLPERQARTQRGGEHKVVIDGDEKLVVDVDWGGLGEADEYF
jgi:hypothetical protein